MFSLTPWRRRPERPYMRYAGSPVRHREPRARVPWRLLLIAGGGAAVVGVLAFGAVALSHNNPFRVQHVRVVGTKVVDPKAVEMAARLEGLSLLTLDSDGAARRVAALPGVAQARIHPDWPDGAVIDISERQGWGYWQVAGNRVVIDADGRVVDRARPPADNAPTVYAIGVASPLEPGSTVDRDTVTLVTRLLSDGTFTRLGQKPQRFDFERSRGLVVRVESGPAAVFGDSHDYEFKVAAWVAMNSRIKSERMPANEIDLRFGKELVVR